MGEILVICEAAADFRTATELADRVCEVHCPEWVADNLEHIRTWRGLEPDSVFTAWRNIQSLAKAARIRYLGHPGKSADYAAARKALLLALKQTTIQAVILIRDGDSQARERRQGMEAARQDFADTLTVIIGIADTKREAWVLNGFEPLNDAEKQKIALLCRELGFDPCVESHRLRTVSQEGPANRQVKKVLEALTNGEYERERQCWIYTPLKTLHARGQNSGLSAYLDEIAERLLPRFHQGKAG